MNIKRVFGTLLTLLGTGSLIFSAYSFLNKSYGVTELVVIGVVGLIFFIAGIGLIKRTKDQAEPNS